MANREGTALSDAKIMAGCPEFFPVPNKQALIMFLQPDQRFRKLRGVKPEKDLRVPPRPECFCDMAQGLSHHYQTPSGPASVMANLNRQYKQDIRIPVKIPVVTIQTPAEPNRPNVLQTQVLIDQLTLQLANIVQNGTPESIQRELVLRTGLAQQIIATQEAKRAENKALIAAGLGWSVAQVAMKQQQKTQSGYDKATAKAQMLAGTEAIRYLHYEKVWNEAMRKGLVTPPLLARNTFRLLGKEGERQPFSNKLARKGIIILLIN